MTQIKTSFDSRSILITGVTRGLGRALALHYLKSGYSIWGCGRSRTAIEELSALAMNKAHFKVVDVADDSAVANWASEVITSADSIDIIINSAAVINTPAPLWAIDQAEFDHVIDVNIKGVTNIIRHFLPHMVRRRSGVIVNFISGSGKKCPTESGAYNASKWAVEALTKTLANEIPAGMSAVALNPGTIDTDMLRTIIGARASNYPRAVEWVEMAADFILALNADHNGKVLSLAGPEESRR